MREITFRAKGIDNGKWVEGYYFKKYDLLGNEEHFIFHADSYRVWEYVKVNPETICQYTGLTDKNGNRIWENDIVKYDREYVPIKFGMYSPRSENGDYNLGFYADFPESSFYRKELGYWHQKVEVAGNVFDNHRFLRGGDGL